MLNDSAWTLHRLDEVAEVGGGITKGRRAEATTSVPYLRVANVQHGRLDLTEVKTIEATEAEISRHRVEDGDVLLLEGGNKEDVGRGWLWSNELPLCLHQNHLHRARPRRDLVTPRFLAYSICRSEARAYCLLNAKQTSNLATINRTQIAGLPVRVPEADVQARVVSVLDAIRADYDAAVEARAAADQLRAGITAQLLGGTHRIPASYDRFLSGEKPDSVNLEPATV